MKRSAIETVLGAVVLLVAAVFMVLAYNTTDLKPKSGYELIGKFYAVDGLTVGSDVRIGAQCCKVGKESDPTGCVRSTVPQTDPKHNDLCISEARFSK